MTGGTTTHSCELSLEPSKVTDESLDHRLPSGWSEALPQNSRGGGSGATGFGVVPYDRVRDGIHDFEVFHKGPSSDMVAVSRVTPSTEPARLGIAEDR